MNEERVIVFLVSYHAGTRRERFHRPDVIGIYSSLAAAQTATALDDYWSGNPAVAQRQRDDPGPDPDWLRWTCEHLYEHDDDVRWAAWGTEDKDDVTNHPAPYSRFYEIVPYYVDGGYVPFQHLPGGHRCPYTERHPELGRDGTRVLSAAQPREGRSEAENNFRASSGPFCGPSARFWREGD